ncbi:CBM35 domain-containing protein [Streptomyces sp. NPDC003703]|uniref:CBM35 domain-containing protein n=1 Tax=Streptomyces sp. NPDC003283 TaxID=3364681 RepID=UPI0036BE305E
MTPGDNGPSTPEDDDPFGYLYADGQANGAQPPSGGYGYPGSVNRVRAVGQRQYGQQPQQTQQAPTAAYGQAPQQQGAYGRPSAHYAAPETLPGGQQPPRQPAQGGPGGGGRRGPNTKGLLIGAVVVVAAVVIGITFAMLNDKDDTKDGATGGTTAPPATQSAPPSPSSNSTVAPDGELPKIDAKALLLTGTSTASEVEGAKADGGIYVTGFNHVGAKVTWSVNGIQKTGTYRLYVRYGIPGVDANATLVVNGKSSSQTLNMKNFGKLPEGDWKNDWQTTWANVNLNKGTNTIEIACNDGNQCNANLDQMHLTGENG